MIQPNELRINNIVLCKRTSVNLPDEHVTIFNITGTNLRARSTAARLGEVLLNYEDIEPVLIMEETLHKCRFVESGYFYILDDIRLYHTHGKYNGDNFIYFRSDNEYIEIKYLHQLQNLYFALTGNELEYGLR